jgi:hypothetical protein
VDNDPAVLAHARALLADGAQDTASYVDADLNDPDKIIASARATLDFTRPVAVLLMGVLGHIGHQHVGRRGDQAVTCSPSPIYGRSMVTEWGSLSRIWRCCLDSGHDREGSAAYSLLFLHEKKILRDHALPAPAPEQRESR